MPWITIGRSKRDVMSMLKHCTKKPTYSTLRSEAGTTTGSVMMHDDTMRVIDQTEMQIEISRSLALKNA
jgi:hypothetical protein